MLFSVIIPTYNRGDLLTRALASVREQTFRDYELIVVDDGSTEDVRSIVEEYGGKYLRQSNAGPGQARNLGAKHARGDYLTFLDSDDVFLPWALQTFANVIATHSPTLIGACSRGLTSASQLGNISNGETSYQVFDDYFSSIRFQVISVGAGETVVARKAFYSVGGFWGENFAAEDHDLVLRLGTAPLFVKIQAPVTLGYLSDAGERETTNWGRVLNGIRSLIQGERAGRYPGGPLRAKERRTILTAHVRPVALTGLKRGRYTDACQLYLQSFPYQLAGGRLKFLLGFPIVAITCVRRHSMPDSP